MKKILLLFAVSIICFANTFNVSNVTEFRQALEDASANGESDTIILDSGIYKTTSDGLGTFTFNDNEEYDLTIKAKDGLTYNDVILDGDNSDRVFSFNNSEESTLTLERISVVNGKTDGSGGGIYINKHILLNNCRISNNNSFYYGGGFYSVGKSTLINTIISNNKMLAYSRLYGGGGFYSGGNVEVVKSFVSKNSSNSKGGGFFCI